MLAESLAEFGNADAERYIARLRPVHDIEADVFAARLLLRKGHAAEAGALLERAFAATMIDPWPMPMVIARGLDLAADIGNRDRATAERLWRALAQPFAVHLQNDHRLRTRIALATAVDWKRLCTEALAPMEPEVPFDADLLLKRVRCYEATGDRHLAAARDDLGHFTRREPMSFAKGLGSAR
jgi:hypothetical protein